MKLGLPNEIYVKFEHDPDACTTVGTELHEVCGEPGTSVQVGVYRLHRTTKVKCKAEEA